ncbi:YbfB/YjiJ family MFS transporter [Nonomuraea terrae]|uniref:YbfB/YjiJ family MFS transporter n=1 Tax=Nonomuraea terrae TaxID=2530383 RepID=UPI00379B1B68
MTRSSQDAGLRDHASRRSAARRALWQAAGLSLGVAAALGLGRFAYGLLVPGMRTALGWSLAQAGAMTTANGAGYLAGALVTAAVTRRLGLSVTFRAGMILTSVSLAATAVSGEAAAQVVLRAVAGLGCALVFVTGGVLAGRLAARSGSASPIGVYYAGGGLGIVLSGAVVPFVAPDRWQLVWLGFGLAALAGTALGWRAALSAGAKTDAPGRASAEVGEAAARSRPPRPARTGKGVVRPRPPRPAVEEGAARPHLARLWRIAVVYALFGAGYLAYLTFLSEFLAGQRASPVQVALTWTVVGVSALVAPALWNRPIAAWRDARALAVLLAVQAVAATAPLAGAAPLLSAIAFGLTLMVIPSAVTALVRATVPEAAWTGVLGALTVVFAAGQTAGPWVAGALAGLTTPGMALAWNAALCGCAALVALTWQATEPHHRASTGTAPGT